MASRNELAMRANNVGFDPTTIANDSKLEQKILWLEKRASALTGTAASTTLTSDATAPADGDTVTLGAPLATKTFTFKTALTGAANEVLIGASAAAALTNLKSATTLTGTPGTDYSASTPLAGAFTATTLTATTLLFVARETNAGNDFVSTETSAHLSFPGATFNSGTAGVAGVIAAGTTTANSGVGVSGDKNTSV